MAITIDGVPNVRVPFAYIAFSNDRASQGPTAQPFSVLAIGQKLAAGTEDPLLLRTVTSEDQAIELYGRGSMLHRMVKLYLRNNALTELKVMAMDDNAAGAEATGKIALSGTATANGSLKAYIGGQVVSVGVATDDTAADVATALAAAITADGDLPVSASANGDDCDLTAKHKGELGNDVDVRLNYFDSDKTPAGLTVAITAMSGGTANPDLADLIAALPDEQMNLIVNPYTDGLSLSLLETELLDRAGPLRQIDGVAIAYKLDSLSNLQNLGNSRNSQYSSITGPAKKAPNPSYEWAAAKAGQIALSASADPALPFQTLPLLGILAPAKQDRFTTAEQEILLSDGIATDSVDSGGVVNIQRAITTYQTKNGAVDTSYLDLNTVLTLSYLRFDFRTQMLNKYARIKLVSDGARVGPGQRVVTPNSAKAEAIRIFNAWENLGLVEGAEQFASELIVERDSSDPTRLNFSLPTNLANQLRVLAAKIEFLL